MSSQWAEIDLQGTRPPCRGGHATCLVDGGCSAVVIGGCDPFGIAYSDIYCIDLSTGFTELLHEGMKCKKVPPRLGHSATNCTADEGEESHIVVFGGVMPVPSAVLYGDTWILKVSTQKGATGEGSFRRHEAVWEELKY